MLVDVQGWTRTTLLDTLFLGPRIPGKFFAKQTNERKKKRKKNEKKYQVMKVDFVGIFRRRKRDRVEVRKNDEFYGLCVRVRHEFDCNSPLCQTIAKSVHFYWRIRCLSLVRQWPDWLWMCSVSSDCWLEAHWPCVSYNAVTSLDACARVVLYRLRVHGATGTWWWKSSPKAVAGWTP